MLSLLQLSNLYAHNPRNADKVFTLAQNPLQGFPLPIVSIHVTKWCCTLMRDTAKLGKVIS